MFTVEISKIHNDSFVENSLTVLSSKFVGGDTFISFTVNEKNNGLYNL